jgi:hypothetical protein
MDLTECSCYFFGWSGTESSSPEATIWPTVPVPNGDDDDDDDECGSIGGMLGRETEVLGENLTQRRSVHHKFYIT